MYKIQKKIRISSNIGDTSGQWLHGCLHTAKSSPSPGFLQIWQGRVRSWGDRRQLSLYPPSAWKWSCHGCSPGLLTWVHRCILPACVCLLEWWIGSLFLIFTRLLAIMTQPRCVPSLWGTTVLSLDATEWEVSVLLNTYLCVIVSVRWMFSQTSPTPIQTSSKALNRFRRLRNFLKNKFL